MFETTIQVAWKYTDLEFAAYSSVVIALVLAQTVVDLLPRGAQLGMSIPANYEIRSQTGAPAVRRQK
jgi:hypothetical protein